MRLLAVVMVFGVTGLFSMVPFKIPRVMFFAAQVALQEVVPASDPGLHALPMGTKYRDPATLETVHGRQDLTPDWTMLLPVAPLFAGTRAPAGLSAWKARRVALPVPIRFRLRAPPAIG